MTKAEQELDDIKNQICNLIDPLQKRERELRNIVNEEFIEKQKEIFKRIEGKLFFIDGFANQYANVSRSICLIIPTSCNDWSSYNSCNITSLTISFGNDKKFSSFSVKKDTTRVDIIGASGRTSQYRLATQEDLDMIKELVSKEVADALNTFFII